jgi:hypothetical protein
MRRIIPKLRNLTSSVFFRCTIHPMEDMTCQFRVLMSLVCHNGFSIGVGVETPAKNITVAYKHSDES